MLSPPPDPVLYENAVAEQKKRAHSIVYGMSAGLYTKLLRLVICPPHWWFVSLENHLIQPFNYVLLCRSKLSPSFNLYTWMSCVLSFSFPLSQFLPPTFPPSLPFPPLTRLSGFVLFWVFSRLFNQIYVQKRHVAMLKQAKEVRWWD